MNFIYFFLFFWVILAPLDPDLDCEFGSRIPDPDPITQLNLEPVRLRIRIRIHNTAVSMYSSCSDYPKLRMNLSRTTAINSLLHIKDPSNSGSFKCIKHFITCSKRSHPAKYVFKCRLCTWYLFVALAFLLKFIMLLVLSNMEGALYLNLKKSRHDVVFASLPVEFLQRVLNVY
jgi:hypothetical protein